MSESLKARRSKEITQLNTSSPRGSEVSLESQKVVKISQNKKISGGGKNGGEKKLVLSSV